MLIGTNRIVFFFSLCTNWYKIPLPRTNRGACCNIDPFDIGHISKKLFVLLIFKVGRILYSPKLDEISFVGFRNALFDGQRNCRKTAIKYFFLLLSFPSGIQSWKQAKELLRRYCICCYFRSDLVLLQPNPNGIQDFFLFTYICVTQRKSKGSFFRVFNRPANIIWGPPMHNAGKRCGRAFGGKWWMPASPRTFPHCVQGCGVVAEVNLTLLNPWEFR